MNFKDYKICNIYGQQMWHDQAIIIGNKRIRTIKGYD